jgi:hypothetical protein
MSASVAPRGSTGFYVARAAFYARVVATVLAAVVSLRFTGAALSHALDVSTGEVADQPVPHTAEVPPLASAPDETPARKAAEQPPRAAVAPGVPVKLTLGISYGPPRSDVYVNGRHVGQTPFLGDTSCKTGNSLKIEILPPKGLPITYLRECYGGSMEISTSPP